MALKLPMAVPPLVRFCLTFPKCVFWYFEAEILSLEPLRFALSAQVGRASMPGESKPPPQVITEEKFPQLYVCQQKAAVTDAADNFSTVSATIFPGETIVRSNQQIVFGGLDACTSVRLTQSKPMWCRKFLNWWSYWYDPSHRNVVQKMERCPACELERSVVGSRWYRSLDVCCLHRSRNE